MIPLHRLIGIAVVLLSTVAEALGQFAFKEAADRPPRPGPGCAACGYDLTGNAGGICPECGTQIDMSPRPAAGPVQLVLANWRWIFLGFGGFIIDGILWSVALYFLDVTVAQPMGSLVFVVVALVSRLMLKEHIPPRRWLGIACILMGSAIIAMT